MRLAADAIPYAGNGGVLGSWNDISGNGNNATAAGNPIYLDSRINGKPTVESDGAGEIDDLAAYVLSL